MEIRIDFLEGRARFHGLGNVDKLRALPKVKMSDSPKLSKSAHATPSFLSGGGEMGARIRAYNWADTPLGCPETWPQPLRTTLRLLLNTGHPMYIWWGQERLCFYNDAYSRSIGPERHPGSLGRPGREVWAEIWPIIGPQIEQVMSGGGPSWHENALIPITRNGRREDVYWTYSYGPIDDPDSAGGVGGVLVVCTETTEQILANQRADEGRARLAELFDQAPGFMCTLRGPDHVFEFANPAFMELTGQRAIIGLPVRSAFPDIEGQGFYELLDQVFSSGKAHSMVNAPIAFQTAAGAPARRRLIDFVYQPIKDQGGEVTGIFVEGSDVTERAEAEAALRESEARLREIADAAADLGEAQFRLLVKSVTDYAIYMLDPKGYVSSWNLGAQRIKGYLPEEIVGQHFSRFYTQEERDAGVPQRGLNVARREGRFETEGWRVRKDGTRFRAHVVIDAIPGDDGEVVGFAKITRDITERESAQRALEQAREALFQSQKLEAIGQLTGGIAHDFNNLLMAVLGSLEMVQKRMPDDPQISRLLGNAMQGARRGAVLTQRMLAFARRQELVREAVDLPALVLGMEELLTRSLGPMFVLDIQFPPGLPRVESDPAQLESALMNVVLNARDAMAGGGLITVSAKAVNVGADAQDLAAGRYVCLSISDQGEGMSDETLARATEPFYTTKGVGKGTGLGLAMIHGLATQTGGALRLKSRLGEGTTVDLWLPVVQGPAETSRSKPRVEIGPRGGKPLTVLAVDDDELVLVNTSAMLEELGHTVLQAADANAALALLRGHAEVALLITDHAMPGVTGAELARLVRAERPGMPIILATGFAELPPGESASLPRLAKPFDLHALAMAIDKIAF